MFIWWVHGASHRPGDALAAAHGLLCSEVAASGVDALGEVIVLHFDVLSEGAFGSDIRRLGPACCTDLNFGGKTMGYFSRQAPQCHLLKVQECSHADESCSFWPNSTGKG